MQNDIFESRLQLSYPTDFNILNSESAIFLSAKFAALLVNAPEWVVNLCRKYEYRKVVISKGLLDRLVSIAEDPIGLYNFDELRRDFYIWVSDQQIQYLIELIRSCKNEIQES